MESPPVLRYPDKGSRVTEPAIPGPASSPLRRLVAVAVKLIAVWLLAQVVEQLVDVVVMSVAAMVDLPGIGRLGVASRLDAPAARLILIAGPVTVATVLWFGASWLARRMVPDDAVGGGVAPPVGPEFEGLLSIGLAVAGAAVLVPAVRELAAATAYQVHKHAAFDRWWHDDYWVRTFWSAVVGLAVSAWLMFGSGGLVRLIVWARTAGRPVPPPADQPAE